MSFTTKLQSSRTDLLYLVTGKDSDKPCWYYVIVDKIKHEMFKVKVKTDYIFVPDYGTILYSGWGAEPPEDIKQKIKEGFG
jgi:hypothetical protein